MRLLRLRQLADPRNDPVSSLLGSFLNLN